jgi:glycosyltransferase involved in cell wall biosynthesis
VTDLPAISIVTPSYQHGRFLEWTMRSVLRQGYPKLEYVVMDGGSTDETAAILQRYESQLAHVESAPDRGQADAVARGFLHTHGEIMGYLNSDDVLAPGALEFVGRYFSENPQVDAIYSHRVFIDCANIVEGYWILPEHRDWMMRRWDYIPQETCFWRRRIYEDVGGINASFQFALDYDLFVRFMTVGRMERVNRFLGAFRRHAASKTATLVEGSVHPEVARVRRDHRIRFPRGHGLMELALSKWVGSRSRKFAISGSVLPGSLPGIGYDYDRVWTGQLTATEYP